MNVSLKKIHNALDKLDGAGDAIEEINNAMAYLHHAIDLMDDISVKGKDNIDALLGCIIGVEMIIGEDTDGRN